MSKMNVRAILVVDDVEETLDGIKALLEHDGYLVCAATDEIEATGKARSGSPDLMLVSLDGEIADVIADAARIRRKAGFDNSLPIVIFCVGELKEGAETAAGNNIFLAHPDNFNQLRKFIARLLLRFPSAARI